MVLLSAVLLLAAWVGWAVRAKVTRYEISDSARLEPESAADQIQPGVSDRLVIVAEFRPAAALGKVRPGQLATLRLDGSFGAQYGTVSARVSHVAGAIRDGRLRVDLAVNSAHIPDISYQHGLPGSVEVEVERISPAALILRSASELVGAH